MNQEIQKQLKELALKRSQPFCYSCYDVAPNGRCSKCGSDDLMRLVPEVGCEYGTDWIVEHILETELEPVDLDAAFEEVIRECYPETVKVGWLELDTVSVMKEMDPVSWKCAQSEWESEQIDDSENYFLSGSKYYSIQMVEVLLAN